MCGNVSYSPFNIQIKVPSLEDTRISVQVDDMYRIISSFSWNQLFKYTIHMSQLIVPMSKSKQNIKWKDYTK